MYFPYLKRLIPDLVVLGMNQKWAGYIMKYNLFINYLKSLNKDDIVCFIDAYDILPTKKIIYLEQKFIDFSKKNPNIKIIVAKDNPPNLISINFCEYYYENKNIEINSGTYIGYAKNILVILSSIIEKPNIHDDQLELIRYARLNPNDIFIDNNKDFFYVIVKQLQQVNLNNNNTSAFIHAAGNGLLENFLEEQHNIECSFIERMKNYIINLKEQMIKIKLRNKILLLKNK